MTDRPLLANVTLVAVTGISLGATITALERSMRQASFANVLLLSPSAPRSSNPAIEWRRIPPLASRQDYSQFMLKELVEHIDSDFALCVQWDGYVLDGGHWRERFAEYDYVGAPWPQFDDCRVGNGGFSLRSRRLLEALRKIPFDPAEPEDVAICRTHRPRLETDAGIRFAPEEVALDFAFERLPPTGQEFGFHGIFNMRALLGPSGFTELLSSLDPGTIGKRESREILRQCLSTGDFQAAGLVLRNRLLRSNAFKGDS